MRLPTKASRRCVARRTVLGMAIARFPSTVLDCADPGTLATFYGAMLDWKVEVSADWAEVRADYGQCICFQQVEGYTPPGGRPRRRPSRCTSTWWSTTSTPRRRRSLELGATKPEHQPGTSFRVFLDPAGHPFCLCVD